MNLENTVKENTILVWDIENTKFEYINQVKKSLGYIPEKIYIVTKQKLSNYQENYINKLKLDNIKIVESKIEADFLIKFILKITGETNNEFTIVSSDSDFAQSIKLLLLKDKKINIFLQDGSQRGVLMKTDLTNKNVSYYIFDKISKRKKSLKQSEYFKKINREKRKNLKKEKKGDGVEGVIKKYSDRLEEIYKKSRKRQEESLEKALKKDKPKKTNDVFFEKMKGKQERKQKEIVSTVEETLKKDNLIVKSLKKDNVKTKKEVTKNIVIKKQPLEQKISFLTKEEIIYNERKRLEIKLENEFNELGICSCCGEEKNIEIVKYKKIITENKLCKECNSLFIIFTEEKTLINKDFLKNTNHLERVDIFLKEKLEEINNNGFLNYEKIKNFDIIEFQVSKFEKNLI